MSIGSVPESRGAELNRLTTGCVYIKRAVGDGCAPLPMPDDWAPLTVARQRKDPASTWSFYREALRAAGLAEATSR